MDIIPAIDLICGECVRLSKGDFNSKKVYSKSPTDIALKYRDLGFKRVHIVDLDGAKSNGPKNIDVLEKIAKSTNLDIQYGGGVKNEESLKRIINAGASRVICGSIAVTDSALFLEWLKKYGPQVLILGADFRGDNIAINGWKTQTKKSLFDIVDEFYSAGLVQLISTDISKDGTLSGPSYDKYYTLKKRFPNLKVTISGGISSLEDLYRIDKELIDGVIVGKAIYERKINLKELSRC
jgi:phosphoribosylformimino-5-aminoimidazole carboxamide ribotide isomerase